MTPNFKQLLGGFGLAAVVICAMPMVADGFSAVSPAPAFEINRALKNDRLMVPNMTVAKRKVPVETVRETQRETGREPVETNKPKLLDGCEPAFSTVTVPTMAHVSSRCVG